MLIAIVGESRILRAAQVDTPAA
ncbi:hypothetical protein ACERZ8_14415 [Tateyamaria armeniaca]|uniref:Uncharacterized protein n=1 Tax=Tateyamaria armeniaca TaxID=2518930 RepID=A0ABW8UVS1_9RHOB